MNLLYLDIRQELSPIALIEILSESYLSTTTGYECSFYLNSSRYNDKNSLYASVDNFLREVCKGLKVTETPLRYKKEGIMTEVVTIYPKTAPPQIPS